MVSRSLMLLNHKHARWDATDHELLMPLDAGSRLCDRPHSVDRRQPGGYLLNGAGIALQVTDEFPVTVESHPPAHAQLICTLEHDVSQRRIGHGSTDVNPFGV